MLIRQADHAGLLERDPVRVMCANHCDKGSAFGRPLMADDGRIEVRLDSLESPGVSVEILAAKAFAGRLLVAVQVDLVVSLADSFPIRTRWMIALQLKRMGDNCARRLEVA